MWNCQDLGESREEFGTTKENFMLILMWTYIIVFDFLNGMEEFKQVHNLLGADI